MFIEHLTGEIRAFVISFSLAYLAACLSSEQPRIGDSLKLVTWKNGAFYLDRVVK